LYSAVAQSFLHATQCLPKTYNRVIIVCAVQGYARLAASCWQESPADRPMSEQLVLLLKQMRLESQSLQIEVNAACGSYLGYFST
jgi:hypothetical protein